MQLHWIGEHLEPLQRPEPSRNSSGSALTTTWSTANSTTTETNKTHGLLIGLAYFTREYRNLLCVLFLRQGLAWAVLELQILLLNYPSLELQACVAHDMHSWKWLGLQSQEDIKILKSRRQNARPLRPRTRVQFPVWHPM